MSARVLIVNADDFGLSPGVNEGIIAAHQRGIVTSASLMVRGRAALTAAAYARQSSLSVGLHLDLCEWEYGDEQWTATYVVVDVDDVDAVTTELNRQLLAFAELVGRPPTHLDSHQHVHREDPVRSAVAAAGRRLGIPVRDLVPGSITYIGSFYGQYGTGVPLPDAITVDALVKTIEGLDPGVTEVACHPAATDDLDTMYHAERVIELATLCDQRVRAAIERSGVVLCRFGDVAAFL